MAKTRFMTRNQNHDDDASSSFKTCAPWSDLNHDVLSLVMMQLGVVDFLSFRGVCKSWRSLACSNENKFMEYRPPMSITISNDGNEKACYLEDFEGRTFRTILPWFSVIDDCIGVTCGYLMFFTKETRDFWLVNPITRHQLHFPQFPFDYPCCGVLGKAILVFSPSISSWVFVVLQRFSTELWFSIEGKGAWNHVSHSLKIIDIYAFKGKIYTLGSDIHSPVYDLFKLCELRLSPHPKWTILKIKKPTSFIPLTFVSSGEKINAIYARPTPKVLNSLHELDVGEMKWVKPREKTNKEYSFFHSNLTYTMVAVRRESWADPRSRSHGRYAGTHNNEENRPFTANMWYFPHLCMNVDRIDD